METKLCDYPCFYYTSNKNATRTEQMKYYLTVASMLGYTIKEAADSSVFFAKVSQGRLFGGKGFTESELLKHEKQCAEATSCSINFNRMFAGRSSIIEKCCVYCPLSPAYKNFNLEDEAIYLKGIIEDRNRLKEFPLDGQLLLSVHPITLSNDIGTYPLISFFSLLFDYISKTEDFDIDKLHDEMVKLVKLELEKDEKNSFHSMDAALNELVDKFVQTTLKQIYDSWPEPVSDTLLRAKHIKITTATTAYLSDRNVLPADDKEATRPERKQKAKSLSGQVGIDMLVPDTNLEDEVEQEKVLEEEKNNILEEHGVDKIEDVSFSTDGIGGDYFDLIATQQNGIFISGMPEEPAEPSNGEDDKQKEVSTASVETVETKQPLNETPETESVFALEPISETSVEEEEENQTQDEEIPVAEGSKIENNEESQAEQTEEENWCAEESEYTYVDFENDGQIIEDVPDDIEYLDAPVEQQPLEPEEEITEEETENEGFTEAVSDSAESIASSEPVCDVTETVASSVVAEDDLPVSNETSATEVETAESVSADTLPGEEVVEKMELAPLSVDPCALCSIGASETFFHNVMRNAEPSAYAFFLRCVSKRHGSETFSSMKNKFGCALCPKKGSTVSCVYPSLSFHSKGSKSSSGVRYFVPRISDDMLPYVNDCTDSQKLNLIDFISEACNATDISVECVEFYGVKGLLFYVGGKFYFFDPAYGSSGFLKPLLSDATKTKFYSINPISVHECFYKMGFKQIRVESIAALFSTVHHLDALAPIGIIFEGYMHRALLDDMYAHIMPYYPEVCNKLLGRLHFDTRKEYESGLKLEWALGKNKDISKIAKGHDHNVMGGCYLHYRITMRHFEDLNVPGHLCMVKINNEISAKQKKLVFERTAGKVASSTSRVHEHTYLVALSSENIAYYSCYESDVFFDELMSCLRSAYREIVTGKPDVFVERIPFKY